MKTGSINDSPKDSPHHTKQQKKILIGKVLRAWIVTVTVDEIKALCD